MAKSKLKEEEEDRHEAEKAGGLELVSIGSLYSGGSWDKKYWSSTRGKDRYPYPVGYQARRAYNGGACKMEIHEGPKGPLFAITSTDGYSCSGQTPVIAWQKFQKNCYPHTKIWQGKRFSCTIDGIEFFGFKNPFVQRLLRELVTNINGIAEQSPLSPSFSNESSRTELNNRCTDACTSPNLPPFLARSQVKGKRSKRQEITNPESLSTSGFKRSRAGAVMHIAEPSNSAPKTHKQWRSTLSFNQEQESCNLPGTLSTEVCSKPVAIGETDRSSAKDGFPSKSVDCSDHAALGPEESVLAWSKSTKSTTEVINWSVEEKNLDRSLDTRVERSKFTMSEERQAGDATASKDQPCVHNVDLYAPDTLDFVQDNITYSAQATQDTSARSVREEFLVTEAITSQGLITESHTEEVIGTPHSNGNSERSDFDSAGHDIAKSMMTFLLPQAIPLLQNKSGKKKKTISYSEVVPNTPKPRENNDENRQFVEIQSPGVHGSALPCSEHVKSVVLDSFDGDQCGVYVTNQPISPSNTADADQPCFDTDACPPCRVDRFVYIDGTESSVCQFETDGIKDIFCHDQAQSKVQLALDERPQDGYQYPCESVSCIKSTNENVLYEENQDFCKKMDENSIGTEFLSGEKDINRGTDFNDVVAKCNMSKRGLGASVHISRNDISAKAETPESGSLSTAQVTKYVYTRKKVSKAASSTRKCNASFSESIICRNSRDDSIPETTRTLLNSEMFQMSSSVDEPHKNAIFGARPMTGDQLNGLQMDETTNPNPLSESMLPFVSQTQTFSCASMGKDASNPFAASVSQIEKPHAYSEGRLVLIQNTSETNGPPVLSVKLGTTFSCYNTSSVKEVQTNTDLKLHRNLKLNNELDGIFDLVGCYFHPMPVLSLLLVTKGDEINVCALCGHLVDKNRTLFLYKLAIEETRTGNPSFVGHTSIMFPSSTDIFGREIALERSGLQLTPDGQNLVLLGTMKTPYCREGRTDCLCSTCSLNCFEQSTVKIVQVKTGYVSVLVKLSTSDSVQCILACEPNHLIAAGESGRLHLWTMNSAWSAPTEEFIISANDCISPCIVELKRVPNCASLVVGNNGFGEFTVWDVSKRMFMARVSSPSASACQFFPISSFSWQRVVHGFHYSTVEEQINGIVDATKLWFSENSECYSLPPLDGEDIAIWLLVSTIPELETQEDYISSDCGINPVGWWRLALLVKNMLILGGALDPRAAAIGSSSGNGIIGTFDGLVYMWEFTTGTKLGTLHHFEGESVSCIATDNSKPGVISVAGDKGQLVVYRRSCK
uniref:FYR C-terminal domain-containing protein n=1 Tax=Salix viminalis TaxID=40686 RepID=A0A6N2M7V0_SALVM